jgi:hypothetical protein
MTCATASPNPNSNNSVPPPLRKEPPDEYS